MHRSTKTYDHNLGFSCAFRQWKAESHCKLLHGYALSFTFVFEANKLDERNWVVDFGGLDPLKEKLRYWFDHTTFVAADDPMHSTFMQMANIGLIQVRRLPNVGCEAFAQHGFDLAEEVCSKHFPHVRVVSCEVREHGANSASYGISL
jgi:6-pyruvoyltetrahydropterin/6-carboxytetrahydropterin synthase